jgi:hypothetical protein
MHDAPATETDDRQKTKDGMEHWARERVAHHEAELARTGWCWHADSAADYRRILQRTMECPATAFLPA